MSHRTQEVQIKKKVCQTAITICRGLSHPTGEHITAFSKGGETHIGYKSLFSFDERDNCLADALNHI
jgi:hypothetical protein